MVLSFSRTTVGAAAAFALAVGSAHAFAAAHELATAQGIIAISEPPPGLRAASCKELVVEAREALDNHLISQSQPTLDNGACRYAITVPAQTAVWLRIRPTFVAGTRVINGINVEPSGSQRVRSPAGSIALRFTVIAATTYFFAPGEKKDVQLPY